MKSFEVVLLARARSEYAAALAWWRLNRPAAPNLLRGVMRAARKLLSRFPEAGHMDETQGGDIRPLLLRGSGYLLFYRLNHDVLRVEVLSVWHARRLAPSL